MAYSELIKNFEKIRSYMRQFYVYGFKNRNEYDAKSSRSYDNEKRRIESWLGDYMSFRNDANGKRVFLSVDSRSIKRNPLHQAFKTKSFTPKDIALHFYILDVLSVGKRYTTKEIADILSAEYYSMFDAEEFDESTVRNKLKEYTSLGILNAEKHGKELLYSIKENSVDIEKWQDAVKFYSEAEPVGVIGSYFKADETPFSFKHHYILHTLDSQVLYDILCLTKDKKCAEITVVGKRGGNEKIFSVYPYQIYISTQTGREYVYVYLLKTKRPAFFRLDTIHAVKELKAEVNAEDICRSLEVRKKYLWGVSLGNEKDTEHIEMDIQVLPGEEHIINRLEREKRCGKVEKTGENTYKFSADVYDTVEMIPWIRTFTGRIDRLECTNSLVKDVFYGDIEKMSGMYGGDGDAVS